MKVLVVGGHGFVGGRVARHLVSAGHEVTLGSRRVTGAPEWLPQARSATIDWSSAKQVEAVCAGMDAVVHAAGMNAQASARDPVAALEFNGLATARLVAAAIRQHVRRFVYFSTAHVYGSPLDGPITEATCPVSLHPYATSHRAGEDAVLAARERHEIDGIVIRLSNAYGAPTHSDADCWSLIVNDLARQAVTTGRVVLRSSGIQKRDFIPMTDVCRALAHLLEVPREQLGKGLFNLGGRDVLSVWDMACVVRDRCVAVLELEPEIVRPAGGSEVAGDLDYRIDAIRATEFTPSASRADEIDTLLEFCRVAFVPTSAPRGPS